MPAQPITRRTLIGGAAVGTAAAATTGPASAKRAGHRTRTADVVVVGAGLAGLTAARQVAAAGHSVIVLEARNRVGGRTLNHSLTPHGFPGRVIEVGGQWIGPLIEQTAVSSVPGQAVYQPQAELQKLAKTLGVGTYHTYNKGQYLDYSQTTGLTPYDSSSRIPTDPGTATAAQGIAMLNQMAAQINLDAPYDSPNALSWDSQTVETWMRQNLSPPNQDPGSAAYSLVNLAIESVFAAEPRDMSLLHVLFYIASAGTLDNLVDTASGAQDSRFVGGSQEVSVQLAKHLGHRVVLNAPVRRLIHAGRTVTALTDHGSVVAKRAIVAIPPTLAGRIIYEPTLSTLDPQGVTREQLTQRFPQGSVIKVQCLYKHPFWRDAGLAGQATSDTGPVKITFDNTPYPDSGDSKVSPGVLIGFMEGDDGRLYATKTRQERYQAVVECFARYFGDQARNVLGGINGYVEMLWSKEEFTGGCYGGFLAPGVWTQFGSAIRHPIGRLHWAGTETATIWNGYMDGAVRSGQRAAAEVLAAL